MKIYRLLAALSIFLLLILLASCAKQPLVAEKRATPPKAQIAEKQPPPAKTPKVKPPLVLPVLPPEEKPALTKSPVPLPPAVTPSLAVERTVIGCLFPLTGRFAEETSRALDAALLAAEIFNQSIPSPWKIVAADSGDTPEKARQAVAYLAQEARVMAIVAISGTVEAALLAREAQNLQTPLILIAPRESVTNEGSYVFQHFLTPLQQVDALVDYARNSLNVGFFSVLYPADDYGDEMVRLFGNAIKKSGGKLSKAISYSKTQTDFTGQIKELAGDNFGAAKQIYAGSDDSGNLAALDYEALFIPDSAFRVKMITAQLAYYNVSGFHLLGSSLWHSLDLQKRGFESLEGAFFVDSFYVNGFLPETNDFVDIYYSAYGREPDNIDALTYDTMKLVLHVLRDQEIVSRTDFIRALPQVNGFRGSTGSISFNGGRVAQKEAFVLRVKNGKIEQVR